jgi:hypothetical protein
MHFAKRYWLQLVAASLPMSLPLRISKGSESTWANNTEFRHALGGNPIRIVTFHQMINEINSELKTTLAATEVGRMLQMFRASGFKLVN